MLELESSHHAGQSRGARFQICLAPEAARMAGEIGMALPEEARVVSFGADLSSAFAGPVIVVLTPDDLHGPHRDALLGLVRAALPGRPILYGASRDRQVLLEAINVWRVLRVVSQGPEGPTALSDAIRKAYEVICLDAGIESVAGELKADTQRLEVAVQALRAAQDRLRHAERLATLGRISTQLIPAVGTHLEALEEFGGAVRSGASQNDPELAELLDCAFGGVRSLHAMLDEIRDYAESRHGPYRLRAQDLDDLIRFTVRFSSFDPLASERRLEVEIASGARVEVDGHRLQQVVMNLLRNAFQASPANARVVVRTSVESAWAILDVENEGPPIADEVRARLFDAFVTTKGPKGLGLGLSMCRTTVERHGGTISYSRTPDGLTRFRIALPLEAPPVVAP